MIIPPALAAYRQFVLYIVVPSKTRAGKTDKIPVHPLTGRATDHGDLTARMYGVEAQAALTAGRAHGIGFVFSEDDPFFFLDIDNCLTADGWSPLATQLCQQFAGCFIEVSHSGTGLHIIGSTPPLTHGTRNQSLGLELYTKARFVALTGTHAVGDPAHRADLQPLLTLQGWSGAGSGDPAAPPAEWTDYPRHDWSGPSDDAELIARMLSSRPSAAAAFGGRASVQDLWNGDNDALGRVFPDSRPEGFDRSSADAALCSHLAFWTGCDCARMDRLFQQSGLMRDKWYERRGAWLYSEKTILHAVGHCQHVYGDRRTADTVPPADTTPGTPPADTAETPTAGYEGARMGYQLQTVHGQLAHFRGCVYVRSEDAILVPDGALLKPGQFKATYGGYNFVIGNDNGKTTKSAWEAFTESQGYNFPKAHETCFRPECPPGVIIPEEGRTLVNTYVPITTPRTAGDASRFTGHVARLLPDVRDMQILLAYMAAVVQYPGRKFFWAPVIQGVQGNGKTLLITVLSQCVGKRYTHLPNPEDIHNKFNAWILRKLFIGIEEVYVADRQEMISVLKILIGNERVDIQGKGSNQETGDNRANFMAATNHKDAIRLQDDDRRFSVFFTAQQERSDLMRDGMSGNYFPELYDWLRGGGYAVVNDYLRSYQIPDELNPATHCHRAPVTSSTPEALTVSRGRIEQEIMEAIEEGRTGFAGGWVSSSALDKLLDDKRMSAQVPRGRRRDLMKSLGYDFHPALRDGRVNNTIIDAGVAGKPRLYVRMGSLQSQILTGAEAVRLYQEAQAGAGSIASVVLGSQGQGVV
jgi:hypothetical protein